MKLNFKQIQLMDFILQRLNSIYSYTDENKKLSLVIKFNNSLWTGDSINLHNSYLVNYYIDNDFWVEKKLTPISDFKFLFSDFNFRRYEKLKLKNINILLHELISFVSSMDTSKLDFQPFLYNAINLETNFKMPFLYLNYDDSFEVVSIIESPKDECTHS